MSSLHGHAVRRLSGSEEKLVSAAPCPVCGTKEGRARYRVEGWSSPVIVCPDCGLGRFAELPSDPELAGFYPDAYYGDPGTKFRPLLESVVRRIAARHIGFLARGLPPQARVLDVGCGRGVLLSRLADLGLEVHGVEISEAAARGADPRARIRIAPDLVAAGYPEGFFDEIVIWHVLEHLRDPRATLREAHRLLRAGGRIVVAVPNFASAQARWADAAWFHLDLPRHLFHFPLPALRRLLAATGFACESEHHFSLRQNPFGWIQSSLNRRDDLPRNGLYTLLHRRPPGEPPPFDSRMRRRLVTAALVRLPLAAVLSVAEALLRTGATVHVVARRV
jgi:2-polyprenyl-3-methyl-5-hydroxy-6-metoxy-1,4-benzoquinol methylase